MKSGKKILIIIMILLFLLLMAGVALAYVYLATDILKTDRELFFEYFAQITAEDGFVDKRINTFYEKKTQTAYENSGKITFENELPEDGMTDVMKKVNDLSINFSGKVDSENQKAEQNIEVDYGNDVILPINYRKDGNKFGLQTDELSKKYIAVKNENLKQLATNLGVEDVSEIPDKIELTDAIEGVNITYEEIEQLKQIYIPILQESLLEENFSSVKTEQNQSYILELSNEQVKNIVIKILEATKQNTLIIDKINEIVLEQNPEAEKIDVSVIDDLIKGINGEDTSNSLTGITDTTEDIIEGVNEDDIADIADVPNLKLTLVQSDKVLSQIIIQSGESTISIKKSNEADRLSYNINCEIKESVEESETSSLFEDETSEPGQANAFFDVQYTGLDALTSVQENYEFGFDISNAGEVMKYAYKINTNTEFNDNISIDELDESEAVFLNDYNETQLTPFLTQVGTRLLAINKNQMTELGLEEYENPILYSNPVTLYIMLTLRVYNMATETVTDTNHTL